MDSEGRTVDLVCGEPRSAHLPSPPSEEPLSRQDEYKKPGGTCGKPGHRGCLDTTLRCGHDNLDNFKALMEKRKAAMSPPPSEERAEKEKD